MTEHASLGVTGGSTGVDEAASLTGLLLLNLFIDHVIINFTSEFQEITPQEEAAILHVTGQCLFAPNHDGLDLWQLRQTRSEAFEELVVLHQDDLCLGVISLVVASFGSICGVDASGHAVGYHATEEANDPLRRVESHHSDCGSLADFELRERLGEGEAIVPELFPGPGDDFTLPFDEHGGSIAASLYSVLEKVNHGNGPLGTVSLGGEFDGQFRVDIGGPVQVLSVLGLHQLLVALRGHYNNALVGHIYLLGLRFRFFEFNYYQRPCTPK